MWEDYYEPSEFDILMDGFKDSIRENVKQVLPVMQKRSNHYV